MDGRIYSPEKGKFVSLKTKHGQKVLENYNEHRIGGDKHKNCAYCKIVNPQTGKLVSTYGQTGGRVITSYNMMGGLEEESPKYKKDNPNNLLKNIKKETLEKLLEDGLFSKQEKKKILNKFNSLSNTKYYKEKLNNLIRNVNAIIIRDNPNNILKNIKKETLEKLLEDGSLNSQEKKRILNKFNSLNNK